MSTRPWRCPFSEVAILISVQASHLSELKHRMSRETQNRALGAVYELESQKSSSAFRSILDSGDSNTVPLPYGTEFSPDLEKVKQKKWRLAFLWRSDP